MGESLAEADRLELRQWLAGAGFALRAARPLAGDVSPRRYERLAAADGRTAILALYPPEVRGTCARFAATTELLAGAGVPVPRVLGVDCERGWMLVEDLGEQTLADLRQRPWEELAAWFEDAAALARRIAALPSAAVGDLNPPLDLALLERELAQTRRLFLEPRGLTVAGLDPAMHTVCALLAADAPVPCHRDYMARNLMPMAPGRVAVLDHQDLRLGPPAYDMASLLNDTLFPPPAVESRLLEHGFPVGSDARTQYHRAAAQRTLKAVGTYSAFAERGSDRHLPLIGPTLARFVEHLAKLPEGERLAAELPRAWAAVLPPNA
jgi:N-acetylmuramate 1-kinase